VPEPITVIGTSAVAAYLGKDGINKLLGPTADYLGNEVRGLVEKCNINLDVVFRRALRILGSRAEEPGQVAPRVLKQILADAPFCDTPVVQEYFAGLLASSRTESSSDDRAIPYSNLISSLSSSQIKFHFLLYTGMRAALAGQDEHLSTSAGRQKLGVFTSFASIEKAFGISSPDKTFSLLEHCLYGLRQKELIAPEYAHGSVAYLTEKLPGNQFSEAGVVVYPSLFGIDLWLWGHGLGGTWTHKFLNQDLPLPEQANDLPASLAIQRILPPQ
jgi:hypothetical protein